MQPINDLLQTLPTMDFAITDAPTLILDPDPVFPDIQQLDNEVIFATSDLLQQMDEAIAQLPKQIAPNR